MIQLVASETSVVIALSAATTLGIAITTLIVVVAFYAVFGDGEEAARDVQRFVDLTEEARALLPGGPVLADPSGETSAAIARFRARKDEARRALWASRQESSVIGRTSIGAHPDGEFSTAAATH